MAGPVDAADYLAAQPRELRLPDALDRIRERVVDGGRRVAVLDDDPVWVLPEESAFPGPPYVIFAGNVGGPDSLAEVIQILRGD